MSCHLRIVTGIYFLSTSIYALIAYMCD